MPAIGLHPSELSGNVPSMNRNLSPRQLATKIAKETSGIAVRHGVTNGRAVLHLIRRRNDSKGITAASETIVATVAAWDLHPWNPTSYLAIKPKEEAA